MTHDELLAKIDRYAKGASMLDSKAWAALRTVVELHKPMKIGETLTVCRECFVMWENNPYPCPTIQAIEKELS